MRFELMAISCLIGRDPGVLAAEVGHWISGARGSSKVKRKGDPRQKKPTEWFGTFGMS